MARDDNKTKQNKDYGYDVQKVYLEVMLTDAETFVRCQSVFDSKSFDNIQFVSPPELPCILKSEFTAYPT